uniref:Large ribosomal subunit protein uL3m n=1 Tax=Octactis speculum TaxID=3111310 RepID=A0A7S2BM36_9STRA
MNIFPKSSMLMVRRTMTTQKQFGRTGALGIKAGMLAEFDHWGTRQELTVIQLDACEVVQVKTTKNDGYAALQLGVCAGKEKNAPQTLKNHFAKSGVEVKRKLGEFRVADDALLPPGTKIGAAHFVPGQLLDVCGVSKGKGFQGAMKRHNFSGQRASHGVSKTHRAMGSTGQCQNPGRVFKGKKMPGRMGNDRVTIQNLWLYKIDVDRNLLYVKGHVPGQNGGFLRIQDAVKGPKFPSPPPFSIPEDMGSDENRAVFHAPLSEVDPHSPAPVNDY